MKNKNLLKLILDIVMTILFLILIDPKNTGMTFHEIAGLAMGAMFVFHVSLNWSWVVSITNNLLNPKLKAKSRWFYLLDVVSLLAVVLIIYTGIKISHVVFPSQVGGVSRSLSLIHKWASYSCLGLFAIHAGLHWRFITATIRKMAGGLKPAIRLTAAATAAVLIMAMSVVGAQMPSKTIAEADVLNPARVQVKPVAADTGQKEIVPVVEKPTPSSADNSIVARPATPSTAASTTTVSSTPKTTTPESSVSPAASASGDQITLTDYLKTMFCTGCSKHCSLLRPQCNIGTEQVKAATVKYQQTYHV